MNSILAYLKQLELTEIEGKLYLSLLQSGPISVRELASNVDIKRTTGYLYIDQLVEKGLVIKMVKGSQKLIAANPPESLEHLVEKKVSAATSAQSNFSEILSTLKDSYPEQRSFEDAEITYYKGKQAVKKIYEDSLSGSELRVYANLTQIEILLAKHGFILEHDIYEKALAKNKNLKIFEIVADEPGTIDQFELEGTTDRNARYQHRYMPASVGLTSPGILMYNNKVAIINGGESLNSIVLRNEEYYTTSIKLFDFIWNVLPAPEGIRA